ncbi:MAG: ribonuclease HI family protein [Synergistaceae bacterium]|nr:ribonuclease HI family protein [Synergistota bacterium]NLM70998.1 ribonuclease HI family protein [Synergistaceae bacterium]
MKIGYSEELLFLEDETDCIGSDGRIRGFFDGASRGNPGDAGAGALLVDALGEVIWSCARPLGRRTNNEAEYDALIILLEEIRERGLRSVAISGDSSLVVKQVTGAWKIKEPRLRPLAERALELLTETESSLSWVPREENREADRLSNQAIDGEKRSRATDASPFPAERLEHVAGGIYIAHGSEDYAVDLVHGACTCPSFQHRRCCKHLDAARRLAEG